MQMRTYSSDDKKLKKPHCQKLTKRCESNENKK